jgi:hypothetical protein
MDTRLNRVVMIPRHGVTSSASEHLINHGPRKITWSYDDLYHLTGESWTGAGTADKIPRSTPHFADEYRPAWAGEKWHQLALLSPLTTDGD